METRDHSNDTVVKTSNLWQDTTNPCESCKPVAVKRIYVTLIFLVVLAVIFIVFSNELNGR